MSKPFDIRKDLPRYLADNNTGVTLDELIAAVASPDVRALFGLVVGPNAIPDEVALDALHVQMILSAASTSACRELTSSTA